MLVFKVIRQEDESGISGTGHVIDGIIFDNGKVVIQWRTEMTSIAIYESYEEFYAIHIASHPENESIDIICEIDWDNLELHEVFP